MNVIRQNIFTLFFQGLWVGSIVFVTYLSLSSDIQFPLKINNIDKVYHGLAYMWLAAVPVVGFPRSKTALTCALMMIPFGILMEFIQRLVAGRFFSVGDMIADTIGVALGIAVGHYLKTRGPALLFRSGK